MPSAIDPSKPIVGTPTTASVRDNFAAAKAEIEALQAQVASVIAALTTPAIITADFPNGSNHGSAPPNTWGARPLNTIINAGGFLIGLSANQFTLPPGLYSIAAEFETYGLDHTRLRLQNVTEGVTLDQTINIQVGITAQPATILRLNSTVLLSVESALEFQQISNRQNTSYGWGVNVVVDSAERFGRVVIHKMPQ